MTESTMRVSPSPDSTLRIAGMRVDPVTNREAVDTVMDAAVARRSSYVCCANVHMVMEAHDDPAFRDLVDRSLLVTPDGQPLVWATRLLGRGAVERVYGPTLTLEVCAAAERTGLSIALYGGTDESIEAFVRFLGERFPALRIACQIAPPFRPLTPEEDDAATGQLAESGAHVVLVGIGCPKQERWMAAHEGRIPAVMIGVGAAFDFHSGRVRQSPAWLQRLGLEWAFRLVMEPRRLWKRYARHNPRFMALFALQWLREKDPRSSSAGQPRTVAPRMAHRRLTFDARRERTGPRPFDGDATAFGAASTNETP